MLSVSSADDCNTPLLLNLPHSQFLSHLTWTQYIFSIDIELYIIPSLDYNNTRFCPEWMEWWPNKSRIGPQLPESAYIHYFQKWWFLWPTDSKVTTMNH